MTTTASLGTPAPLVGMTPHEIDIFLRHKRGATPLRELIPVCKAEVAESKTHIAAALFCMERLEYWIHIKNGIDDDTSDTSTALDYAGDDLRKAIFEPKDLKIPEFDDDAFDSLAEAPPHTWGRSVLEDGIFA